MENINVKSAAREFMNGNSVFYRLRNGKGQISLLTNLSYGGRRYGFVYLESRMRTAKFVRDSPTKAIEAAIADGRREIFTTSLELGFIGS